MPGSLEHSEPFDVFLASVSAITLGVPAADVVNVTAHGTVTGLTVATMFSVFFCVVVLVVEELNATVTAGAVSLFRLGSNCNRFSKMKLTGMSLKARLKRFQHLLQHAFNTLLNQVLGAFEQVVQHC